MKLLNDGFKFLEGKFEGLKGYVVGRMIKSRRGKLYIDNASWGPDAGSIEYGHGVPFGGNHVFIGKIGEPGPEPDICTDLVCKPCSGSACHEACVRRIHPWCRI